MYVLDFNDCNFFLFMLFLIVIVFEFNLVSCWFIIIFSGLIIIIYVFLLNFFCNNIEKKLYIRFFL